MRFRNYIVAVSLSHSELEADLGHLQHTKQGADFCACRLVAIAHRPGDITTAEAEWRLSG